MAAPPPPVPPTGTPPSAPSTTPTSTVSSLLANIGIGTLVIGIVIGLIVGFIYIAKNAGLSTGESVGIVLAVVIGIGLVVMYIFQTYTLATKTPAEAEAYFKKQSASSQEIWKKVTAPFVIIIYFLPYFVAFYAIINDMITSTFSLSLGVVMGFILNMINLFISKWLQRDIKGADLCGLPGLAGLNAGAIPQAPLFVSTVMAYIATFTTRIHGSSSPTYIAWSLWGASGLAQISTLLANKTSCGLDTMWLGSISTVIPILLSIVIGLGVGGLTGFYGNKFTSSSTGTPSAVASSAGGPLGSSIPPPDSNVGTCSPPNDSDQFVCETYKDGKLVTSTVASS